MSKLLPKLKPDTAESVDHLESPRKFKVSEAECEALIQAIGFGAVLTDQEGRVKLVNHEAEALLGYSAREMIGRDFSEVWWVENEQGQREPRHHRIVTAVLAKNKKLSRTKHYFVTKHRRFPAAATAMPVIVDGKTSGAMVIFRNIRREREVDAAKSEFVSLASHQLRTPLTAIKLFSEAVRRDPASHLPAAEKKLVENIYQANEKMIHLVNNLLNVSRLESGRLKIRWEELDLTKFLARVIAELEPAARERHLKVNLESKLSTAPVSTDPTLLRQLFVNIINNAIAYTPEGGSPVTVSLARPSGKPFLVAVRDHGIGIPKRSQVNIFKRFYRAENAVTHRNDGTGLGLYLCQIIARKLRGKIWLESTVGKGSTFFVSLPVNQTS